MAASSASQTGLKGRPVPHDFEAVFIEIGRLACEEHYRAGRMTIDRWLEELGKSRLIELRAAFVRQQAKSRLRPCPPDFALAFPYLGLKGCRRRYRADWRQVYRWLDECGRDKLIQARLAQVRPALKDVKIVVAPNLKSAPDEER